MKRYLTLVVLLLAACTDPTPGAHASQAASEDATLAACRSGVAHANLHVNDVTALDFAVHDCASLAMLEAELRANPGYLDATVTAETFATNRCMDPAFLDVGNALVCQELGLP